MNFFEGPLIVGIICYFTYMLFELFVRRGERMKLLDLFEKNLFPTESSLPKIEFNAFIPRFNKKTFTSLRVGCLLVGLGFGLFVGLLICIMIHEGLNTQDHWRRSEFFSVAYGSCVLFFGGLGLLIAYVIESVSKKKGE